MPTRTLRGETVRSYHVDSGAGIAGLAIREHEIRAPGPGEALVAVQANSLSFRELRILQGNYVLPVKPDVVPISDGAGEVIAVGDGVTRVREGDRVMACLFPDWLDGPFRRDQAAQLGGSLDGLLTDVAVLPDRALVAIPPHLPYEEASTLPCVAVTAWNAVTGGRRVLPGETVVVLGSGGVSLFAAQFAKLLGARVIATTRGEEKARRLRALGADEVIDREQTPGWHDAVRELTANNGAELIIDVAGSLDQALRCVAVGGEIACVGVLDSDRAAAVTPGTMFASVAAVRVVAVGSRAQFEAMNRAIALHQVRPVIDRVFGFEEAPEAYRYYEHQAPFGKVVISR